MLILLKMQYDLEDNRRSHRVTYMHAEVAWFENLYFQTFLPNYNLDLCTYRQLLSSLF